MTLVMSASSSNDGQPLSIHSFSQNEVGDAIRPRYRTFFRVAFSWTSACEENTDRKVSPIP
jgi:hypothetical protein